MTEYEDLVPGMQKIVTQFDPEKWDSNQGKRLIKRLRKAGITPGTEFSSLVHLIKTGAAKIANSAVCKAGGSVEEAMAAAIKAMDNIVVTKEGDNLGLSLFELMLANGSQPGRVKATLDDILAVATGEPVGEIVVSDSRNVGKVEVLEEFPTHPGFPSNDPTRENY